VLDSGPSVVAAFELGLALGLNGANDPNGGTDDDDDVDDDADEHRARTHALDVADDLVFGVIHGARR
jgi:hypothetical protein